MTLPAFPDTEVEKRPVTGICRPLAARSTRVCAPYSTAILRGLTRSDFGSVSVRTPWSILAEILLGVDGRVQLEHAPVIGDRAFAEQRLAGQRLGLAPAHDGDFRSLRA